ncbi:hypothetical protein B0T16DRAFT_414750 [Cercophora newfieldiana]|uniref:Uncharacterized protein n=1 Tax=Cercophora newfieldiana TaxID=92897 RepID=A0AA40CQ39_9PEZI|nr:hypothetical protein B0T16DRAFT_414750 [Cercophora newfieldiana]
MAIKNLTADDVNRILTEKDHLDVVYCFTSKTNEKAIEDTMKGWATQYPEAAFSSLDLMESRPLADELGIDDGVARFLIFRDGKKIGSVHCAAAGEEQQVKLVKEEILALLGRRREQQVVMED